MAEADVGPNHARRVDRTVTRASETQLDGGERDGHLFSMASGAKEEAAALAASLAGLKDSGEPTIFDKVRTQCATPP